RTIAGRRQPKYGGPNAPAQMRRPKCAGPNAPAQVRFPETWAAQQTLHNAYKLNGTPRYFGGEAGAGAAGAAGLPSGRVVAGAMPVVDRGSLYGSKFAASFN